jgi:hypothetical protein
MKDIRLPEFGTPDDFIDLRDIVKSHTKKDSSWAEEIAKVTDTREPGQVQQFMEHPIKARAMLQQLSASLVKYQAHAIEIREIYVARWNNTDSHTPTPARSCSSVGQSMRRVTLLK